MHSLARRIAATATKEVVKSLSTMAVKPTAFSTVFHRAPVSSSVTFHSRQFAVKATSSKGLGTGAMLDLTQAVALCHEDEKLYGPFFHAVTKGGYERIIANKTLQLNSGSGIGGRVDAVYAFARVTSEDVEKELTLALENNRQILIFYTSVKPHAVTGMLYRTTCCLG